MRVKIGGNLLPLASLVVALLVAFFAFSLILRLFVFLLVVLGVATLTLFLSMFVQNYGRYGDVERSLSKSFEDLKKFYGLILKKVFGG